MTPLQQETFDTLIQMVASVFSGANLRGIRGALRLAISEWEAKSGHTVQEAEKWPFYKYQSECNKPVLRAFVERLIAQKYDREKAEAQLLVLLKMVKAQYTKKEGNSSFS
mgnify:FL=1